MLVKTQKPSAASAHLNCTRPLLGHIRRPQGVIIPMAVELVISARFNRKQVMLSGQQLLPCS